MTELLNSLVPLIVELDQAENSGEDEEKEHRIEEDESGYAEPANIFILCEREHQDCKKTSSPHRTHIVTQCRVNFDHPSSPAVHHAIGTKATPKEASMTLIAL